MLKKFLGRCFLVGVIVVVFLPVWACADEAVASTKGALTLPVSVYLLEFSDDSQLSAQHSEQDVKKVFDAVNAIWSKAGITWNVDSVATVKVASTDFTIPAAGFATNRDFRDAMARVIPDATETGRWRVYFVRKFPVEGSSVYIVEKGAVLYGELNKRGEGRPTILAHELGHSLGLQHDSSSPENLMYSGKGMNPELALNLDPQQIKSAQAQASQGPLQRAAKERPERPRERVRRPRY